MTETSFPVLSVLKILDKQTLVLAGSNLNQINIGSQLVVLAEGPRLEEIGGIPLVIVKAEIEVVEHAGKYLIASPPGREVKYESSLSAIARGLGPTTVFTRPDLTIQEKDMIGNPSKRAVAIGDAVIRRKDLELYVDSLSLKKGEEG